MAKAVFEIYDSNGTLMIDLATYTYRYMGIFELEESGRLNLGESITKTYTLPWNLPNGAELLWFPIATHRRQNVIDLYFPRLSMVDNQLTATWSKGNSGGWVNYSPLTIVLGYKM